MEALGTRGGVRGVGKPLLVKGKVPKTEKRREVFERVLTAKEEP